MLFKYILCPWLLYESKFLLFSVQALLIKWILLISAIEGVSLAQVETTKYRNSGTNCIMEFYVYLSSATSDNIIIPMLRHSCISHIKSIQMLIVNMIRDKAKITICKFKRIFFSNMSNKLIFGESNSSFLLQYFDQKNMTNDLCDIIQRYWPRPHHGIRPLWPFCPRKWSLV